MLCYVMLCYVMLCYVMLCYVNMLMQMNYRYDILFANVLPYLYVPMQQNTYNRHFAIYEKIHNYMSKILIDTFC